MRKFDILNIKIYRNTYSLTQTVSESYCMLMTIAIEVALIIIPDLNKWNPKVQ